MVLTARRKGLARVVVAALPDLPHPDATFDAVAASFVLNHTARCELALTEMFRVARPSAKIAISSWAKSASDNAMGEAWQEVAETFVDREALGAAMQEALPCADRFTDAGALESVLQEAGLRQITIEQVEYPIQITTEDYLASRSSSTSSRFIESVLVAERWKGFTEATSQRLYRDFGSLLEFATRVNFATGIKPGRW
jgi:SAM-dependent methyltransferase